MPNGQERTMEVPNSTGMQRLRRSPLAATLAGGAIAFSALIGIDAVTGNDNHDGRSVAAADADVTTTTAQDGVCAPTWEIKQLDNDQHRVVKDGIKEIKEAKTDKQAEHAGDVWLETIKTDPEMLLGAHDALTGSESGLTPAALVDKDNCATPAAERVVDEMRTFLAISDLSAEAAPVDGVNTGVDASGAIVEAHAAGISGDRDAIKVENRLKKSVTWIMARCGNLVFKKSPGLPKGPTDQTHPTPVHPTTSIPTTPTTTHSYETIPLKHDDGRLPGRSDVPADQDHGTPDKAGQGPSGQQPGPDGYVPGETRPTNPNNSTTTSTSTPTTTPERTTATTSPQPTNTIPPQPAQPTTPTTLPQSAPRPPKP